MPVNIYQAVWIFLIYAFLGWCTEVAYAAVAKGKFVNRGFLNGPVCPIYGFGMLIVVMLLWGLRHNLILLFLGSAGLTTALEFATGLILEKFFHDKWWDYSDKPFNIKGYICLEFTILWGLAAAFVIGAVHPFIYAVITKFPFVPGMILLAALIAVFLTDLAITVVALARLPKRFNAMLEAEKALKAISDKIGGNISETAIAAEEKVGELVEERKPQLEELKADYENKIAEYKKLFENRGFVPKRIFRAFPNLKNGRYRAVFDRFSEIKMNRAERIKNEKDGM